MKIKILIPVYNDWQSLFKLLDEINSKLSGIENEISVIIVNDASTHDRLDEKKKFENIYSIKILNMKINQGHARCIATGLKYIFEKDEFDYVIPMDGDGEDRPEEIEELISQIRSSNNRPIVGERVKRSENLMFKIFYQLHKLITLTFTGKSIKFGNFTCLPKLTVEKLINEKATWNSFSGSLRKIENNLIAIPSTRGIRYFGPSKMSFSNLVKHSLSIISVFRMTVLIRSALFIIVYILMIKSNASIITAIPLILLLVMIYSISSLSLRENMDEFEKSLENIKNIDNIK
ncbi:glycosyltransferase [Candidatus Pelagibacter communis]|uniref:glycosyltransferase n=1 Tax=Pelagibacter ubique TaxID=198252 RepID=UPI000A94D75E|nr:glycosyltransferase [Candidatus Pelagibacter ubique]|tara:strand:- start:14 stop:883 length:870 start_codon:yes stop_codon:yes gene_type:complete